MQSIATKPSSHAKSARITNGDTARAEKTAKKSRRAEAGHAEKKAVKVSLDHELDEPRGISFGKRKRELPFAVETVAYDFLELDTLASLFLTRKALSAQVVRYLKAMKVLRFGVTLFDTHVPARSVNPLAIGLAVKHAASLTHIQFVQTEQTSYSVEIDKTIARWLSALIRLNTASLRAVQSPLLSEKTIRLLLECTRLEALDLRSASYFLNAFVVDVVTAKKLTALRVVSVCIKDNDYSLKLLLGSGKLRLRQRCVCADLVLTSLAVVDARPSFVPLLLSPLLSNTDRLELGFSNISNDTITFEVFVMELGQDLAACRSLTQLKLVLPPVHDRPWSKTAAWPIKVAHITWTLPLLTDLAIDYDTDLSKAGDLPTIVAPRLQRLRMLDLMPDLLDRAVDVFQSCSELREMHLCCDRDDVNKRDNTSLAAALRKGAWPSLRTLVVDSNQYLTSQDDVLTALCPSASAARRAERLWPLHHGQRRCASAYTPADRDTVCELSALCG